MPTSVLTSISPVKHVVGVGQLGNRITRLRPISSTVIVKSVPRTAIVAVGVLSLTFSLLFLAIAPDAYRTVPIATFIASLPVPLVASYTKSSMTSLLCRVIDTLVLSSNVSSSLAFEVVIASFILIPTPSLVTMVSLSLEMLPS